jgi:hypothetical protein
MSSPAFSLIGLGQAREESALHISATCKTRVISTQSKKAHRRCYFNKNYAEKVINAINVIDSSPHNQLGREASGVQTTRKKTKEPRKYSTYAAL